MIDKFFTIENDVEKEIIEKKSRFIAKIVKVNSEDEASSKLAEIKKFHRDAKHNVFAYRIANSSERFSDDGEPSGTAGVPILDILRGENLQNVLVVVTRYFGGILLGTGGLVRAYSGATKEAILSSKKIEMNLCSEYEILVDYSYYDIVNHYLKKKQIPIKKVEYAQEICINIILIKNEESNILAELEEITERKSKILKKNTYYYA